MGGGEAEYMKARALVRYLGRLTVSQGRLSGEPFKLLPWQRRFVNGAFAPDVFSAALSVGRGNGKTALLSGIAAATLDGPLMVPRGETLIVASSFEQARIAFEHVLAFMGDQLEDRDRWKVWDTAQQARIEDRKTKARVRCLGSDPHRAHGLAPVLVLADEPAQWLQPSSEKMKAALQTAMGKMPGSRLIALGTRPDGAEHWFAKMLAGGCDYAQTHASAPTDPPFRKSTWRKANPSLSHFPDLAAAIKSEAGEAKRDQAALPAFRALRLNAGMSDIGINVLIESATWLDIEGEGERAGPCAWGIDLGTSAAMSAVAAYWPETGRLEVLAAFPAEPSLEERGLRDGVGGLYSQCREAGDLILAGTAAVNIEALVRAALSRFGTPAAIIADRWRDAELRDSLQSAGMPFCDLILRGQGFRDGAEDVRAFRRSCLQATVTPQRQLLMRSAMSEARTVSDAAGNEKLSKGSEGGRRMRARDDAAAAAILAVAHGSRMARRPRRPLRSMLVG